MDMKVCSKCKEEKLLEEFNNWKAGKDGKYPSCKVCVSKWAKEYREKNKEKIRETKKKYYYKNLEKIKEKKKEYQNRPENKERRAEYIRKYYQENKERIAENCRIYNEEHKEEIREWKRWWFKNKRDMDICFKLKDNIRRGIQDALKRAGTSKAGESALKYLPFKLEELKEHLENQFDENMTWKNYGSYWHIDHIIPQAEFYYEVMDCEEFKKCWSLKNLRPLEASENCRRGAFYAAEKRKKSKKI